jgi:uncharacterized protein YchJ
MDHYSSKFQNPKGGYAAWKEQKRKLFAELKSIRVTIENVKISFTGDTAKVVFTQQYQDNLKKDTGEKTLHLVSESGRWMIVGEEWKALPKHTK